MNVRAVLLPAALLAVTAGVQADVRSVPVSVSIGEYSVARVGDVDLVTIPGGQTLGVPDGRPEVPCYVRHLSYPAEYRIQDVVLKSKSGLKTDSGLILPVAQPTEGPAASAAAGVFPTADFAWGVRDDESTLVTLSVYPFRYDPKTRRSTFHRDYEFEVRYVETQVTIADADVDTAVYDPGQTVRLTVRLENAGAPQEVRVRASVYRAFSTKSVAEIPARTIASLGKIDSITLEWLTANRASGDYTTAVFVTDAGGSELGQKRVSFRLGNPQGEVTDFTAAPQTFKVGDRVRFTLGFKNTGTSELAGECVVRILKAGGVVDELRQKMKILKPGGTTTFRDSWSTARAEKSVVYTAVGFVDYAGTASDARSVMLSTNVMPSADFTSTPDTARAGQEVGFDASASTDRDGSVAQYRWEFGDGGEAEGVTAVHRYHEGGEYRAKLTVTDNEGGQTEVEKVLVVAE